MKNPFKRKNSQEKFPEPSPELTADEEYDLIRDTANGIGCFETEAINEIEKLRNSTDKCRETLRENFID